MSLSWTADTLSRAGAGAGQEQGRAGQVEEDSRP